MFKRLRREETDSIRYKALTFHVTDCGLISNITGIPSRISTYSPEVPEHFWSGLYCLSYDKTQNNSKNWTKEQGQAWLRIIEREYKNPENKLGDTPSKMHGVSSLRWELSIWHYQNIFFTRFKFNSRVSQLPCFRVSSQRDIFIK